MKTGLMMECDYREGRTQEEAFDEAFETAENAEAWGFDGVWLAERHFAPPGSGRAIPSVVASPLIFATAIAAKTSHIRVGTAVLVLPLGHPVRMAEEVATLDHISQGRFDLGIGRSGFPWAYDGYDIPYSESRARFREYFDVMKLAWTEERFSYQGEYYNFRDVCLIPKPARSLIRLSGMPVPREKPLRPWENLACPYLQAWVAPEFPTCPRQSRSTGLLGSKRGTRGKAT